VYLDNTHTSRAGWRYTYKGSDLLPYAKKKLTDMCEQERAAREEVITLTRDPATNPEDRRVQEAKRTVATTASVVEELMVYVHQFAREPEKEFSLSSGDVVFFGVLGASLKSQVEDAIKPRN
jgi:hypothetical protein